MGRLSKYKRAMDTTALIGILLASVFSLHQINEAKRSFSLTSLSMIRQYFADAQTPYLSFLMENAVTLADDNDMTDVSAADVAHSVFRLLATNCLFNIEYMYSLYMRDLFDNEAKELVQEIVAEDIELVLWLGYDEDEGSVGLDARSSIRWIKPNLKADDYPYVQVW